MWQYPNPDWTIYASHFSILLAVVKMHCLYANAKVQPSVQYYSCYMTWKTKDHTWCRYCHLCINAPMWREKRWLQGIIDRTYPPPMYWTYPPKQSCRNDIPYYNSPNVVMCVCVCLSLNYSFIFAPIFAKFGHPIGMARESSMKE